MKLCRPRRAGSKGNWRTWNKACSWTSGWRSRRVYLIGLVETGFDLVDGHLGSLSRQFNDFLGGGLEAMASKGRQAIWTRASKHSFNEFNQLISVKHQQVMLLSFRDAFCKHA